MKTEKLEYLSRVRVKCGSVRSSIWSKRRNKETGWSVKDSRFVKFCFSFFFLLFFNAFVIEFVKLSQHKGSFWPQSFHFFCSLINKYYIFSATTEFRIVYLPEYSTTGFDFFKINYLDSHLFYRIFLFDHLIIFIIYF